MGSWGAWRRAVRSSGALLALGCWVGAAAAAPGVESELAFHRGALAYGEGRLDEARAEFERVLEADPRDAGALQYLGLIAQARKDAAAAIELYQRALEIRPDDPDIRFDLGTALLETGRNAEAEQAFEQVLAEQPDRARAHLLAGVAAYRRGAEAPRDSRSALDAYAEALAQLERAAALDPSLRLEAQYYAGLAEAFSGDRRRAQETFAEVERQSPLHPLSISARNLREQLEPKLPERAWDAALTVGGEWDSNPTVAGEAVTRDADFRGVYQLQGRVRAWDKQDLSATLGYDGYVSTHSQETEVDLQTHLGWASASWRRGRVQLAARYDFAYTFIDLSDRFRRLNQVTPTVAVQEGGWGISQLFYQFQDLRFLESNDDSALDRDGDRHIVGLNQYLFLPEPTGTLRYLRIGAFGDFWDTDGTEFRYNGWELSSGAVAALPAEIDFTLVYRFGRRYYRDISIYEPEKRRDRSHWLSVELTRPLGRHWEVSAAGSFLFNHSNVDVYEYNRYVVGTYLSYRF